MVRRGAWAAVIVCLLSGCGSVRSSGSDFGSEPKPIRAYVGNVDPVHFHRELPLTLAKHGYIVVYEEYTPDFDRYETQWRRRALLDDERGLGLDAIETRLVIRARKLRWSYSVTLFVETQVPYDANNGRKMAEVSLALKRYASDVARSMYTDMALGLHR